MLPYLSRRKSVLEVVRDKIAIERTKKKPIGGFLNGILQTRHLNNAEKCLKSAFKNNTNHKLTHTRQFIAKN